MFKCGHRPSTKRHLTPSDLVMRLFKQPPCIKVTLLTLVVSLYLQFESPSLIHSSLSMNVSSVSDCCFASWHTYILLRCGLDVYTLSRHKLSCLYLNSAKQLPPYTVTSKFRKDTKNFQATYVHSLGRLCKGFGNPIIVFVVILSSQYERERHLWALI